MIVDNLGPPGIKETLLKFHWEFRQVSDKFGGRKKKPIFLKVKAQSSFMNVLNYRVLQIPYSTQPHQGSDSLKNRLVSELI